MLYASCTVTGICFFMLEKLSSMIVLKIFSLSLTWVLFGFFSIFIIINIWLFQTVPDFLHVLCQDYFQV